MCSYWSPSGSHPPSCPAHRHRCCLPTAHNRELGRIGDMRSCADHLLLDVVGHRLRRLRDQRLLPASACISTSRNSDRSHGAGSPGPVDLASESLERAHRGALGLVPLHCLVETVETQVF
jgi:hypothetical protein